MLQGIFRLLPFLSGTLIMVIFQCLDVAAQDKVPENDGFGAHFVLMPGVYFVKSNVVASGAPLLGDISNANISSLDEAPASETIAAIPMAGEINYTFSKSRTQLYFGNRLVDIIRLDGVLALGIRQEIGKGGILAGSFLFTPFELNFWEDPFVENEDRIPTAFNQRGVRLRWGKVFQTNLEITVTARKYLYDNERSGEWLLEQGELSENELVLLNRNGETVETIATYKINLKQHYLQPGYRFNWNNHSGNGIANNRSTFLLGYGFRTPKLVLDSRVFYITRTGNEIHPVFDEKASSNGYGFAIGAKIPVDLFNSTNWSITLGAEYARENFNTEFYSTRIAALTGGLLWRMSAN